MDRPRTLGELRASGYRIIGIKDELRRNLIHKLRAGAPLFPGIIGYDTTVIPQVQNAILSRHDMLFLGLRGQAKTRMLRQLTHLLDDAIPIVAGSEINDNPFAPLSLAARERVARDGDATAIEWIGRERRYHEKLATPDVTIADLIGEIDLVKHAEGRYLSDERTMHYGLIPRSQRGIFCINELPDLSPKIQVGLFNVLEERDIQIRGYPIRLPLDLCLVFSANPEDYTSRGRIVSPLKDRIGSVIRTHYPLTRADGIAITDANAWTERGTLPVIVLSFMKEILEETARLARASPAINQHSGVSVRLSIAGCENLVSNAERRALLLGESIAVPRISDLAFLSAAARGKVELMLVEDDGQEDRVIARLVGEAVKNVFAACFDLKELRPVVEWFEGGNTFVVGDQVSSTEYIQRMHQLPALAQAVGEFMNKLLEDEVQRQGHDPLTASVIEFIMEGLHVENRLNKAQRATETIYRK